MTKKARKTRKRRSKKRQSSSTKQNITPNEAPEAVDSLITNDERSEASASKPEEFDIQVPSSALMPARKMGDPPPPPLSFSILLPVKTKPTDMETEKTSLGNDLHRSGDLPLNSQEAASKTVSAPARKVSDPPPPPLSSSIPLPVKTEPTDMETEETSLGNDLHRSGDLPLNSQEAASKTVSVPARKMSDRPPPPPPLSSSILLPFKTETTEMETEKTSLGNDLHRSSDLPLNSQEVSSKTVSSVAHASEHEFEYSAEKVVRSSSETNSCMPVFKIKEEPIQGHDFALTARKRNADSDIIEGNEHVRKKIKVERTDTTVSVTTVSDVKATEQCSVVFANQSDDRKSSISTSISRCFTDDSNSTDNVLNMPIEPVNTQQLAVIPPGFIKIKQEPNSVADASVEDVKNGFAKYGLVIIKKEPEDNTTPSVNNVQLGEEGKTIMNMTDISDSKCLLNETLTNSPINSGLVSAINIPQSPLPLKSTSITESQGIESLFSSCSKTSEEKVSCLGNRPCSSSTFCLKRSENEELEKSNIASLADWYSRNTSLAALSSKSQPSSSKITVGSLKERLCLYYTLFDVREALDCANKRESALIDSDMKLTNPELPNVENEIEDFISSIKREKESENALSQWSRLISDGSQQQIMDVDGIVSPKVNQKSSLTPTCSDTSIAKATPSNSESQFVAAMKINSLGSEASPFSPPMLPPNKLSCGPAEISSEALKLIMSPIPKDQAQSNLLPSYTSNTVTAIDISCDAAVAKQFAHNSDNNNSLDYAYDHARNSVMNRPVGKLVMNSSELNRDHSAVSTSFIGNESTNESHAAKTEYSRKQSMNVGPLNNMVNRNIDSEQNFVPTTSHIVNISRIPSFVPSTKSRHHDPGLVPTPESPRNRTIHRAIEMSRTNSYQQHSKSTPHAEESVSISLPRNSVVNPNTSRPMTNAMKRTNIHDVHSSIAAHCNYEIKNVPFSDAHRVDSSDKRKLNLEPPIFSAKPSSRAAEPRMDSGQVRDPRLRRNLPCRTTSNVALNPVTVSAETGSGVSSLLPSGLSNLTPLDKIITPQDLNSLLSSSQFGSTAVINKAPITDIQRHSMLSFQSLPHAASNTPPTRTPVSKRICVPNSDAKSPASMPVSKLIHQSERTLNKSMQRILTPLQEAVHSTRQGTSESNNNQLGNFPYPRGHVADVERWHNSIGKKILSASSMLRFLLEWHFDWLAIQMKTQNCPPICGQYNVVKDSYDSVIDYYNTYFPLHMLSIWLGIYDAWKDRIHPPYKVKLHSCEEAISMLVKVQCTITMDISLLNDFLKREEILCVRFTKDGKEDALFGCIYMVGEKRDSTRDSDKWRKVMVSFHTAENLNVPLGSTVQIQKLGNLRVLLKQHDALKSLEGSPFEGVILKPKEHLSQIALIKLPDEPVCLDTLAFIVQKCARAPRKITLVVTPPCINRISFITNLVQISVEKEARVLVCLKDPKSLIELASRILKCISSERCVLALKPSEIKLPDSLVRHTLRERIKIGGKEPSENDVPEFCLKILKASDVILTVLSSIFMNESRNSGAKSSLTCIIDDATLCTETETMLPLYYNVEHMVLIGDPQKEARLHPNLQKYGYHKSLYGRLYKAKFK